MNKTPPSAGYLGLILITLGVLGWGIFHAVGGTLAAQREHFNPARGVIVFTSTALFLAFWWLMLFSRNRRNSKKNR